MGGEESDANAYPKKEREYKKLSKKMCRYIYIPKGYENLKKLWDPKIIQSLNLTSRMIRKIRRIDFYMCTKDGKNLFGKKENGDLIQFNLDNPTILVNYGQIYHQFGDFIITKEQIRKSQVQHLLKFDDIETSDNDEPLNLNERKKIPEEMLKSKLILGAYLGCKKDKNLIANIQFYVNNVELHNKSLVLNKDSLIQREFQLYLEDAYACENDEIYNTYGFGNEKEDFMHLDGPDEKKDTAIVKRLTLFTLPYLFSPKNIKLDFEAGVIGDENTKLSKKFELSKQAPTIDLPKYDLKRFQASDLKYIVMNKIHSDAMFELQSLVNDEILTIPGSGTEHMNEPMLSTKNSNFEQIFITSINANDTFSIKSVIDNRIVLAVTKESKNSYHREVEFVKNYTKDMSEEQQWYYDGESIINLAGGYLTTSKTSPICGPKLYCTVNLESNFQKWNLKYQPIERMSIVVKERDNILKMMGKEELKFKHIKYGFPKKFRCAIWLFLSESNEFEKEMLLDQISYESLQQKDMVSASDLVIIGNDVPRTFSNIAELTEETREDLRQQLRRILVAYCNFNETCDYTQGMNSIAAMILVHFHRAKNDKTIDEILADPNNKSYRDRVSFTETSAFWLFATIMLKYGIRNLYSNNFGYFLQNIAVLEVKLQTSHIEIQEKIDSIGLNFQAIFTESYFTLFMHNIELDSSAIILDLFFLVGIESINKILISLLIKNKQRILSIDDPKQMFDYLKEGILDLESKNMSSVLDPTILKTFLAEF